jgi:acylphosphatase
MHRWIRLITVVGIVIGLSALLGLGSGEMAGLERLHLIVRGRVQGVFMREYTRRQAESLGITGWCRNLQSGARKGQVEILAEGERGQLEALLHWVRAGGSPKARVDGVDVEWAAATAEFQHFLVTATM